MWQGQLAPLDLTEAQARTPMFVLHRKGSFRLRCAFGFHRWTPWDDARPHLAHVRLANGSRMVRQLQITRRFCPVCSSSQTMLI